MLNPELFLLLFSYGPRHWNLPPIPILCFKNKFYYFFHFAEEENRNVACARGWRLWERWMLLQVIPFFWPCKPSCSCFLLTFDKGCLHPFSEDRAWGLRWGRGLLRCLWKHSVEFDGESVLDESEWVYVCEVWIILSHISAILPSYPSMMLRRTHSNPVA